MQLPILAGFGYALDGSCQEKMLMNLVVVPFHDWRKCEREGFRTRDAHLMQEFGRHPSVHGLLVVNRPISLAEVGLMRRNWRVQQGTMVERRPGTLLSRVGEKTYTLDILVPEIVRPIVMRRNWTPYIMTKRHVAEAVRVAIRTLGMDRPHAMLIHEPWFAPLAVQLAPDVLAFDALDNMLQHPMYRNMPRLGEYYHTCQQKADLLFANSQETAGMLAELRPDALHVPNGVDTTAFTPMTDAPYPDDLAQLPRPIIGYAGKMQEMVDTDLLENAADRLPTASFVFIGQKLNPAWTKPLWRHRNVHYLGDKSYTQLPHYLNAFDICIIPYSVARQHGGDPIKFYEYLAMGKPVVTTKIGNVHSFAEFPQVQVAESHDEFIAALERFASMLRKGATIPVLPLPSGCSWAAKADLMLRLMNQQAQCKWGHRGIPFSEKVIA